MVAIAAIELMTYTTVNYNMYIKYQNIRTYFTAKYALVIGNYKKISGYEKKNMMPIETQRHPVRNFNKISSHEIFLKNLSFNSQLNSCLWKYLSKGSLTYS